jgi:hypothetical protein
VPEIEILSKQDAIGSLLYSNSGHFSEMIKP